MDTANPADAMIAAAIAHQRAAHRRDPYPSGTDRRDRLNSVIAMLRGNRARIRAALLEDFGKHPPIMTDLIEIAGGDW